ncbi:hypothetical protein SAMN02910340_01451 [Methanosarcina thermophila]|uniref:Zinc finger protein 39 n=1 Tax=Methanosarcina thermophila TaxID=2210 RepID=A0A1I6ZG88_METTE|nr:MAG: hypothetical protein AAY43_03015 [Methanosarcina sp. 795]BAW28569.1 zinc finger protein 39 [Methanosarcina thermophila]GLI13992.1 hypothetical protein MTHERMMSTA1_11180 [Methanosarcina thermophila MST-A1]SFT61683.1 hypothetical protein SAMN02910340_01451 [Methanosarcina thermophila]
MKYPWIEILEKVEKGQIQETAEKEREEKREGKRKKLVEKRKRIESKSTNRNLLEIFKVNLQ